MMAWVDHQRFSGPGCFPMTDSQMIPLPSHLRAAQATSPILSVTGIWDVRRGLSRSRPPRAQP